MEVKNDAGEAPLCQPSYIAAPKRRRPTPGHPPYAEMVRVALRELAEEGGSTEASISGYIQSNYTQLPLGHSKLVPYYLGMFVAAGEVFMLSPDRFALRRTSASPPPTPPHHSPTSNPNPNPSSRRSSSYPHTPRRRGRPPKRKRTAASGSAVGLKLPPWPRRDHATHANAPPPRRGRGRPRKNSVNAVPSEVKTPSATDLVLRPRLIIRPQSAPSSPIPDTFAGEDVSGMTTGPAMGRYRLRDGITRECDSRNVDGLSSTQRKPDEKSFPANAPKKKQWPPHVSALPAALQLELKEALLPSASPPAAWQQAEPDEEPVLPAQLRPETGDMSLPLVSLHSEPEVEMLLLDQMQPEPEGALLLLQPESELVPRAPKQVKSTEEQSLLTLLQPETQGKQYLSLPATVRPKSKEDAPPRAAQPDAESVVLPASVHLERDVEPFLPAPLQLPKPAEEPLAPGLLQLDAKQLKEDCLLSSSIQPPFDESYFPLVSVHPEPCKELLLLDTMQLKLEEEFLQLLPLQSDTEEELLQLPAPMQSELHEEPRLPISTQSEPAEQPVLPAPWRIELTEESLHLAPLQPEPIEQTSLQPEPHEGSFQTARLLSEPKEESLLLPAMPIETKEELLPLAAIEPEGMEESSQPAPVLAMEEGEKNGHSSKRRRTHAKHRRLWFEC